jgi:hypothetical protein
MKLHLVDGTYELFRHHFGAPPRTAPDGPAVGATLGLLRSLLLLLTTPGVTHVACAFDHVIESFRNALYPGYKTGAGVDPTLLAQFALAEEAVAALGLVVWPMVEFEADDALASATARFQHAAEVDQIVLCSPDKDLAQLIAGSRIVGWDRRRNILLDEAGVVAKFGVRPHSIPDWLGLVGDAADGFPGVPGWGGTVRGDRAGPLLAPGSHPRRSARLGAAGHLVRTRDAPGRELDAAPSGGAALSHAGDAARGCAIAGNAGRSRMAGGRRAAARGLSPAGR